MYVCMYVFKHCRKFPLVMHFCMCTLCHVCVLIVSAASSGSGRLQIALNLDLRDGTEETAIGLALWTGQFDVARELLEAGKLEYLFIVTKKL